MFMKRFSGAGVSGGWRPSSSQSCREVVGAIVMILRAAELLVPPAVAGGEEGVVDPARGILDHGEDRAPLVGHERIADRWNDSPDRHPAVLHRHEFPDIVGAERPGIDHLLPFRVD